MIKIELELSDEKIEEIFKDEIKDLPVILGISNDDIYDSVYEIMADAPSNSEARQEIAESLVRRVSVDMYKAFSSTEDQQTTP